MEKVYYNIREVSEITGVKPHVLRYWETEFPMLRPVKDRAGRRLYRKRDLEIVKTIKKLLYEENYTIKGARKKLEEMEKSGELNPLETRIGALKRKIEDLISSIEHRIESLNRHASDILKGLENQDISG